MISIRPKTYNEAVLLARCLQVRKYAPGLRDEVVENMYKFLSEHPLNKVGIAGGVIYFQKSTGEKTDVYSVAPIEGFGQLIMGASCFALNMISNNTSDSSGCGCGGNNNNNNNNNNNA